MIMAMSSKNCIEDNVDAAARLFVEHGDFIRKIISYKIVNDNQKEDLFQDLFLFFACKPLPANIQNIRSYLYKVIANKVFDAARQTERHRIRVNKYAERVERAAENGPEDALIQSEEMNKMLEFMKENLPRRQAQAITLRYESNYNFQEMANEMNVNKKSAIRYVCVGLKKLRQVLITEQDNLNDYKQR